MSTAGIGRLGRETQRLVDWNVAVLCRQLKKLKAHRKTTRSKIGKVVVGPGSMISIPLDEVQDIVNITTESSTVPTSECESEELPSEVVEEITKVCTQ